MCTFRLSLPWSILQSSHVGRDCAQPEKVEGTFSRNATENFLRNWNPTVIFAKCLSLFSIKKTEVNTQKGQQKVCIFYQHDVMTLQTTVLRQWRPPDPGAAVAGPWTLRRLMHEQDWGCPVEPFFTFPPLTIDSESKFYFLFCISFLWIYGTSPIWGSKLIYVVGFCKYLWKIQLQSSWKQSGAKQEWNHDVKDVIKYK